MGTRRQLEGLKMDLRLIARKIWRHKPITIAVIVLALAGAGYAITVKQALYEASSSYLLVVRPRALPRSRSPATPSSARSRPTTRTSASPTNRS